MLFGRCLAFAALPVCGETRSVWVEDPTWPEVSDAIAAGSLIGGAKVEP